MHLFPLLAQADINTIPSGTLKALIIFALVAIVVTSFAAAALFAGLQYLLDLRKSNKPQERKISGVITPEKSYVTEEMSLQRHLENQQRLESIEGSVKDIWSEMRKADTDNRNQLIIVTRDFERAIGKLEGTLQQIGRHLNNQ